MGNSLSLNEQPLRLVDIMYKPSMTHRIKNQIMKHEHILYDEIAQDLTLENNLQHIVNYINFHFNVLTYESKSYQLYCRVLLKTIPKSFLSNILQSNDNVIIVNMYFDKMLLLTYDEDDIKENHEHLINDNETRETLMTSLNSKYLCNFKYDFENNTAELNATTLTTTMTFKFHLEDISSKFVRFIQ